MLGKPAEVRSACVDDAEEIAACLRLALEPFRSHYTDGAFQDTVPSLETIQQRIAAMTVYVAFLRDGRVIGTLAAAARRTAPNFAPWQSSLSLPLPLTHTCT
jgi:hypothetical protein